MTVNDLRKKYIGTTFQVKASGKLGKCIQVNGHRKLDEIVIRFCLWSDDAAAWYSSEEIEPVKETLF